MSRRIDGSTYMNGDLIVNGCLSSKFETVNAETAGISPTSTPENNVANWDALMAKFTAAGGGTVQFAPGEYRFSSRLVFADNVVLRGLGNYADVVLKPSPDSGDACNAFLLMKGIVGGGVFNVTLDGAADELTQASAHSLIKIAGSSHCVVEGVKTTNCGFTTAAPGGAHIFLTAYETADPAAGATDEPGVATENNRISNNICDDAGHICSFGIHLNTNWLYDIAQTAFVVPMGSNLVDGNYLEGFTFNGVSLEGPKTEYNRITNNRIFEFNGAAAYDNDKGASYNVWSGNVASDFLVSNPNDDGGVSIGFLCQGYLPTTNDRTAVGNIFIGNVIRDLGAGATGSTGFRISGLAHDTLIANNVVDGTIDAGSSYGIQIVDQVSRLQLIGNQLHTVHTGIRNEPATVGANVSDFLVQGNMVEASNTGIRFANTDGGGYTFSSVSIVGNTVLGSASTGIQVADDISDSLVMGNSLRNTGANGMLIGGQDLTIQGNVLSGQSSRGFWVLSTALDTRLLGNTATGMTTPLDNDATDYDIDLQGNTLGTADGRRVMRSSAAPSSGTYAVGDIVYHTAPAAGGNIGWVCTTAGTPGTWKTFGDIAA